MARFRKRAATLPETSPRCLLCRAKNCFPSGIIPATPLALNGCYTQQELHWPQLFRSCLGHLTDLVYFLFFRRMVWHTKTSFRKRSLRLDVVKRADSMKRPRFMNPRSTYWHAAVMLRIKNLRKSPSLNVLTSWCTIPLRPVFKTFKNENVDKRSSKGTKYCFIYANYFLLGLISWDSPCN
jgi:hypothetical protein